MRKVSFQELNRKDTLWYPSTWFVIEIIGSGGILGVFDHINYILG